MRLCCLLSLFLITACTENPETSDIDFAALSAEAQRELANAPASFTLHDGLSLQTFAGEPMLTNPTNLDVDERGRAWVCTAQNYRRANHDHPELEGGDEILILEDTDGDGRADGRKVFYKGPEVNAALGIAKLGDRVYVAASPNLLVFTDADGDDVPDRMDTLFTGLEGVDHDHGVHAVVFGPDGKLYFNFGNAGQRLRMKNGELAVDKRGNAVEEGQSFRQGMVFRCNADGSDLEILGHNFRNNFEVAVDAYGRMWQSDNDDDGNQATRINYVMDYGNYGYQDERTGAAWQQARVGMHPDVPKRHWHLNDPGVVPNLLQTGSGSPTGILIYEGHALPDVFTGQMIHCEPGHNVVRSYPVTAAGAGYAAETVPLLESEDSWFRPSDVCAAPDGSLLVADWYDPGVGGHLMGDIQRGRVYRLHGKGHEDYRIDLPDLSTAEGALAALGHVNQATRYLAFQHLLEAPARDLIVAALEDAKADPRGRIRAAWLLAAREGSASGIVPGLLADSNVLLREAGVRIARQYPGPDNELLLTAVAHAAASDEAAVQREGAIGLRYLDGPRAHALWAKLAGRYDGRDRWMLEALGIGSDLYADGRYAAWLATEPDLTAKAAKDLVWRSRATAATGQYPELIAAATDGAELNRYFRGLQFHDARASTPIVERALYNESHPQREALLQAALATVDAETVNNNRRIRDRLTQVIPSIRGTDAWMMIVKNTGMASELPYVLSSSIDNPDNDYQDKAAKLIAQTGGIDYIKREYAGMDTERQEKMLHLARHFQTWEAIEWLKTVRADESAPRPLRNEAIKSIANNWNGIPWLMEQVESGELGEEEAEYTARVLSQCWRAEIRDDAIAWLTENREDTTDLAAVIAAHGDVAAGQVAFGTYCAACHQVGEQGVRYGPALTQIGDKLGRQALLEAIVYPSQGIGFGYEGFVLNMADGKQLTGYIEGQTENELSLRMMGGLTKTVKKADIESKTALSESLMTAGLHDIMEQEELVDLLSYLESLKAEELSR